MQHYSILDLSPIPEGGSAADAFATSAALAQAAEAAGYHRYWLAEHHNMPGIASAATPLVIAHVAAATRHIRVGAGGMMLPNHAPLVVAEQFGTLATLYPGRIDLGLGRAPGTDMATARALRRRLQLRPFAVWRRYSRRFCMKRVQIRALNLKPIGRMVKRPFGHKSPNGAINHARGALQGQKDHARQNGWLNPAIAALQSYIQFRRPRENRLDRSGLIGCFKLKLKRPDGFGLLHCVKPSIAAGANDRQA